MHDFVVTLEALDAQKVDSIRETVRLSGWFRGVIEAREGFDISLHQAMDLTIFFRDQYKLAEGSNDLDENK